MKITTFLFTSVITAGIISCTKTDTRSDAITAIATRSSNGIEDNPNGGGGTNVSSVPAVVSAAFSSRYPDATTVQWKLLSSGDYKAEFYSGNVKWQATFSANGTLIKEEKY